MTSMRHPNPTLFAGFFGMVFSGFVACSFASAPPLPRNDLAARIESGTAPLVLDVRSTSEYEEGHVPGAVHIPFPEVDTRHGELAVAKDEAIVVYCAHGPRAAWAARSLSNAGYTNVRYLEGHMTAWAEEGRATEAVPTATPVN